MKKNILLAGSKFIPNFGDRFIHYAWENFYQELDCKVLDCTLDSCIENKQKIDLIHFPGGGYINDILFNPDADYLKKSLRIKSFNKDLKIICTGQGFFPLFNHKKQIFESLINFDLIDVRDEISYEIISELSTKKCFTGDDLFLNHSLAIDKSSIFQNSLIINIQKDIGINGQDIGDKIIDILLHNNIQKKFSKIFFVSCMDSDYFPDEFLISKLYSKKISIGHINYENVLKNGFPIGSFVVTTRYHPHMVSSFSGVNGIAISTSEYYLNKHKALKTLGSNWRILKNDELYEINFEHDFNNQRQSSALFAPNVAKKTELTTNILNLAVR